MAKFCLSSDKADVLFQVWVGVQDESKKCEVANRLSVKRVVEEV